MTHYTLTIYFLGRPKVVRHGLTKEECEQEIAVAIDGNPLEHINHTMEVESES